MDLHYGYPFTGSRLDKFKTFLEEQGLVYDEQVQFSVCIMDGDIITASGALDANVLKCIAVDPKYQSEGLSARIVTELINKAAECGQHHLFIFTKPENMELFSSMGFNTIAQTQKVLLMENLKNGIGSFVSSLQRPSGGRTGKKPSKEIGSIVANCNPFTNGHLYLIETAASKCDSLHIFIISENKSEFPEELRRELAVRGTAHIPNVIVQPTGPYLISAATFPEYFLKDESPAELNAELDLTIFAEYFARPLGITHRFVGTEPNCQLTAAYNRRMKEILPRYNIEVVEVPRLEISYNKGTHVVSASRVRSLLEAGALAEIEALVPPATYQYLSEHGKPS